MPRWRRSARSPRSCPSCCRSAGHRMRVRCGTGRRGSARVSPPRVPPRSPRVGARRPALSWSGWMAAMSAAGIGARSATSRWSRARSSMPVAPGTASPSPAPARRARPSEAFRRALAAAGVRADTPATVLCDGEAGLWRLRHAALPGATVVLDRWHVAVRFEHARQAARGLGAGTADAPLARDAARTLDRAKWCLWHGRWKGCRRKLVDHLCRWTKREGVRDAAGTGRVRRQVTELLGDLDRSQAALVPHASRRRRGEPISTAFVESGADEIVAGRRNKKRQMRWNRTTVQPFLDVRTAVLNGTLEDAFRRRYPGFRPAHVGAARS